MKEKIVIALLSFYLLASTEFHQILSLPLLVKHYVEHREQVADMTFLQFLVMHYKTDVPHDDQDMKLPFKTCHHSLSAQTMAMPIQKITLTSGRVQSQKILLPVYHSRIRPSYLEEIFQPPRS